MVSEEEELRRAFEEEKREVREEIRKERREKVEKTLGRAMGGIEKAVSRKAKKLIKPGEAYKFGRQLAPHLMAALTGTKVQRVKKGRGRGRPKGTYKARVLPSGRVVKVPTHIYKKMLAAEKAQIRLAQVQRQMAAEELAMQQDMRYQPPTAEDQFLEEPDQLHEMELARARQLAEMEAMEPEVPPRPSVGRRIIRGVRDFGRGVSRIGRVRPQMVDEFGRPIAPQPRGMEIRREPRVTAVSERTNLLSAPNIFNNPGQSTVLWNKRRSY